jgi:putative SOS response-associated peptidase YedK
VCNEFGNNVPYSEYLAAFSQIRAPVVFPTAAPNLEPRDDIWPTETAPVFRRPEEGVELVQLRWGFPPARPKGAPVINFRSEGRRFPKGRCLIPASHFVEFTGTKSPKSKWKFTKAGKDWFCFAGLWRPMPVGAGEAFTLLTTEPSPDVAPNQANSRPQPPGLAGLARPHPPGIRAASPASRREPGGRTGSIIPLWRDQSRGGARPLCRNGSGRN